MVYACHHVCRGLRYKKDQKDGYCEEGSGEEGVREEVLLQGEGSGPSLPLENLKIAFPSKPACVFRLRAS